jgi:transposase
VCGHIGVRRGFKFYCPHCDKHEHADANASRNIGKWTGMFCAFDPSKASGVIPEADLAHGVDGSPLNLVSDANSLRLV